MCGWKQAFKAGEAQALVFYSIADLNRLLLFIVLRETEYELEQEKIQPWDIDLEEIAEGDYEKGAVRSPVALDERAFLPSNQARHPASVLSSASISVPERIPTD